MEKECAMACPELGHSLDLCTESKTHYDPVDSDYVVPESTLFLRQFLPDDMEHHFLMRLWLVEFLHYVRIMLKATTTSFSLQSLNKLSAFTMGPFFNLNLIYSVIWELEEQKERGDGLLLGLAQLLFLESLLVTAVRQALKKLALKPS
ncbi:hypothetical protein EYF80_001591 [Liparis tanakae]|uniref:Uncharacterized protein n=1 Tax=Liparis tanakae TaxID=230148 RepID=A0A4Z2JCX2_9TELE|nr:hypothetical protein EYF80_001591 [Liparis tanakae]